MCDFRLLPYFPHNCVWSKVSTPSVMRQKLVVMAGQGTGEETEEQRLTLQQTAREHTAARLRGTSAGDAESPDGPSTSADVDALDTHSSYSSQSHNSDRDSNSHSQDSSGRQRKGQMRKQSWMRIMKWEDQWTFSGSKVTALVQCQARQCKVITNRGVTMHQCNDASTWSQLKCSKLNDIITTKYNNHILL